MHRLLFGLLILVFGLLISCEQPAQIVLPKYEPKNLHEKYVLSLDAADLSQTALGLKWIDASNEALKSPIEINAPYEQEFYVLEDEPKAYAFKVDGSKGHKIEVSLEQTAGDSTLVFLDAYRVGTESSVTHELIASADKADRDLFFEVVEDGSFVIRFQNELLRKGQFRIKIIKVPSLDFPVAGGTTYDIGSLFGVDRDAGKRRHEGIDIFAKRHTPIIAPSAGNINYAGTRKGSLGGTVIWMRDNNRNQTIYFAHLQDVFVKKGDKVVKGDTIGSVGNSGNAITTAPHLHFGIYQENGAVNPYDHVVSLKTRPNRLLANTDYLGQVVRTKRQSSLRSKSKDKDEPTLLDKHQFLKVNGCFASYYNVELPDGQQGYIFYDDIRPIENSIRLINRKEALLLDKPSADAIVIQNIKEETVKVLASTNTSSDQKYHYVESPSGERGWMLI